MKFCSDCGSPTQILIPEGDNRERHCCSECGTIHYQNPRIIAACIPVWEDQVLMCKRAIEPRLGYWTLPAGFMELGETTEQAAARETEEEAHALVEIGDLFAVFNLPHIAQVYMVYRAQLLRPEFSATDESLEVVLMREREIPWSDLAFETMRRSLKYFFEDRAAGNFQFRTEHIQGVQKSHDAQEGWINPDA